MNINEVRNSQGTKVLGHKFDITYIRYSQNNINLLIERLVELKRLGYKTFELNIETDYYGDISEIEVQCLNRHKEIIE